MGEIDHRQFLKHFLTEQPVLYSYLLAALGDLYDADDFLQDVAAVLWEKFGEFYERRSFRAWALGVARLELLMWKRSNARTSVDGRRGTSEVERVD